MAKPVKALDPGADFENPVKRQEVLPGMENRALADIEDAARKYTAIRDRRIELNSQEAKLKDLLLGLLKKHDKREYKRDGISVWIQVEEETVKVKVTKSDDEPERKTNGLRDKTNSAGKNRTHRGPDRKSQSAGEQTGGATEETASEAGTSAGEADEDIPF